MKKIIVLLSMLFLLSSCTNSSPNTESTTAPSSTQPKQNIITGYTESITPIYNDARSFSDGLAAVCIDGKWGFIDKSGKEVISCKYDSVNSFVDGISMFGVKNKSGEKTKYGYMDKTGKEIYPAVNEYRFTPPPNDKRLNNLIQDGMLLLFVNGKWGFADYSGKEIIPPTFDSAYPYSDDLALVCTGDYKTGKWSYIDKTGKTVLNIDYDNADSFYEGLAAVYKGNDENGKWGFIDKSGKEVIPCTYYYVDKFENGMAGVSKNGEGTYSDGFIDRTGSFVIEPKYNFLITFDNTYFFTFCDGMIPVTNRNFADKYGFIDTSGKLVVDYIYDEVNMFSNGLAAVRKGDYQTGKWGFIDKSGKEVIPCIYGIQPSDFNEGAAVLLVETDKKYIWTNSLININGKEIVPSVYNYISDISEGMAVVQRERDGKKGFIKLIYEWF